MADEISLSLSLTYKKNSISLPLTALSALGIDVAGHRFIHEVQLIGASEEALKLGELASLGVCWARNMDAEATIEVRSATGAGNDIIQLLPGEQWVWRWGSDVSAPFAIGSVEAYLEYAIFET